MPNPNLFDESVGLLKRGTVVGFDSINSTIKVKINNVSSIKGQNVQPLEMPAPYSLFLNNGVFIGSQPIIGSSVIVGQGSGGQYYFVSFFAESPTNLPELTKDELLIQSNDQTKITLDNSDNISIGSNNNQIHINTNDNLISNTFNNINSFSSASIKVEGLVKRDLRPNTNFDQNSKLTNDSYDSKLFKIGLDPTSTTNSYTSGSNKNPIFIESREIVYEFQPISNVTNDVIESNLYANNKSLNTFIFPNRRKSRSDTLSLSLFEPNFLMESVKGTVIDIFGNILDINRVPLPIGQDQNTLKSTSVDKVKSFQLIKELERKSLAYHFELNARKDLLKNNQEILPDINSNADYARSRSRLFLDIDKEGLIKLNIPSSSDKGNIPLLTRYENYSSFGPEDNGNPNKLIFRNDNLDIFQDSFAASSFDINTGLTSNDKGSIKLNNNGADGAPIDRITNSHIKHGTAYHDLFSTCYAHQKNDFLKYVSSPNNPVFSQSNINKIPLLKNIVSNTINISGDNANAGGRSLSMNLDGSAEMSIGANTIDRQSLWLDTAGGSVINMGRDKQNISAALSMNGDVYWQIGGMGVSTDSRFQDQNNGQKGAVLDIRVFNDGLRVTLIRIDNEGIKICSPGNIAIHSAGDMKLSSDSSVDIQSETVTIQGRMVLKEFGGSI